MINKQRVCLLDRCVSNCPCKSNNKDCTTLNGYSSKNVQKNKILII